MIKEQKQKTKTKKKWMKKVIQLNELLHTKPFPHTTINLTTPTTHKPLDKESKILKESNLWFSLWQKKIKFSSNFFSHFIERSCVQIEQHKYFVVIILKYFEKRDRNLLKVLSFSKHKDNAPYR